MTMCMEDIRLGRKSEAQIHSTPFIDDQTPMVDDNPDRIALVFYPSAVNDVALAIQPGITVNASIVLWHTNPPMVMTLETHGTLVTKKWFAKAGGADPNLIWSEITLLAK